MDHLDLSCKFQSLDDRTFEGYGSTFGNVDLGGDIVLPGAFSNTLAKHRAAGTLPKLFWMHQADKVAGKWLEVQEDETGLYVKGQFANTQLGNDTRELLKQGAVNGLSIGYQVVDDDYNREGVRLLKELNLFEVSVVSMPMNPEATVTGVKFEQLATEIKTITDWERVSRKIYGMSKATATRFATKTWPAFRQVAHMREEEEAAQAFLEKIESATVLSTIQALTSQVKKW